MLTASGLISKEWNMTPIGLPWDLSITTMQLPNKTGSLARSGSRKRWAAKVCQRPMIFVQDLGSTFGKKRSGSDVFGTNPRGIFSAWEPKQSFQNPQACELRAVLDGDKHVLKEAQELMIQRLGALRSTNRKDDIQCGKVPDDGPEATAKIA